MKKIDMLVGEIEEAYQLGHIGYSLYKVLMEQAREVQSEEGAA
jgi:hypothetical protein